MKLPRLYPILDTATLEKRGLGLVEAAEVMLGAGVEIFQLRHKGPFWRTIFEQAETIATLCQRQGVLLIIDDRADIAKLLQAGLHLGQDDLPPAAARKILGPEAIIGFSTHNEGQLRHAEQEPVDYLALGPIFGTQTKERPDPVVGLEKLREWRRLTERPLVAIGGITRDRARQVIEAGADSVAVISDLYPESCTRQTLRARVEEWLHVLK